MVDKISCGRKRARIRRFVDIIAYLSVFQLSVIGVDLIVSYLRQRFSQHFLVFFEDPGLVIAVQIIIVILIAAFKVLIEIVKCALHILLSVFVLFGRDLVVHVIDELFGKFILIGKPLVDVFVGFFLFFSAGARLKKIFVFFSLLSLFVRVSGVLLLFVFKVADKLLPAVLEGLVGLFDAISDLVHGQEVFVGELRYRRVVGNAEIVLSEIILCVKQNELLSGKVLIEILNDFFRRHAVILHIDRCVLAVRNQNVALIYRRAHLIVLNSCNYLMIISVSVDFENAGRTAHRQRSDNGDDYHDCKQFSFHYICSFYFKNKILLILLYTTFPVL